MLIFLIMIVDTANNQNKWKDFFHFHNFLGWKLNKDSIEKGEIIATSLVSGEPLKTDIGTVMMSLTSIGTSETSLSNTHFSMTSFTDKN